VAEAPSKVSTHGGGGEEARGVWDGLEM
jgi:hypothetical protein